MILILIGEGISMKYIEKEIIILFLLLIICMVSDNCLGNEEDELKQIAYNALKEKYTWTRDYTLAATKDRVSFFNSIHIYKIFVTNGPEPAPIFIAAIDEKKETYIFSRSIDIDEFNRLIRNNKKQINNDNIIEFINCFLFIVDYKSSVISDIDDIEQPFATFVRKETTELAKAPRFEFKNDQTITEFYSWNKTYGFLRKWNIIYSYNGEVLQYKFQNIVSLPIRI
jgi:hypothetical protein